MSSVFELVRNNPFNGPVAHAKCEGLKVNEQRTVAAVSASAGSGTTGVEFLNSFVSLKEGILSTIIDLSCWAQGQMSLSEELLSKNRSLPVWQGILNYCRYSYSGVCNVTFHLFAL